MADAYDEMYRPDGQPRAHYEEIHRAFAEYDRDELLQREQMANLVFRDQGITFNVYDQAESDLERILPFDLMPRLIPAAEWRVVEDGLKQRIRALNLFLRDIYHEQRILSDNVVPKDVIYATSGFQREMLGVSVPHDIYTHVVGTDLVRDETGEFLVLEDNLRSPSGISYVLENRMVMTNVFPELFKRLRVRFVRDYGELLLQALWEASPHNAGQPQVALLTPGHHNSAYFEHGFLAREMGIQLVEGRDLVVEDRRLYMQTTRGLAPVDVLYRRVDDQFLDPVVFNPDSILGVPGLFHVYQSGNLTLANAIGNGVADDKAIYSYVPDMIRYYLDEDPILKNVPTYRCADPAERSHVLAHLERLVVKPTDQSGGYGLLIGPAATKAQLAEARERILATPQRYIAQPLISLSTHPVLIDGEIVSRRVDLRPFVLHGSEIRVIPGGLTRVARQAGSFVVNSSQGGGSKDTWVLSEHYKRGEG